MIKFSYKHAAVLALAAAFAVGCQTAPDEPEVDEEARDQAQQAIDQARSVIDGAEDPCTDVGNADDYLADAEAAFEEEDFEEAEELAGRAADTAEDALSECYREYARECMDKVGEYTELTSDQRSMKDDAESAYEAGDYREAYELCRELHAELKEATMSYTVERGDSLWRISGKSDIYDDPYQWPLIYRKNSDKIEDADLIFPDQEFSIDKNPTADQRDMARDHARTRGEWELGRVEDSDRDYLDRARD